MKHIITFCLFMLFSLFAIGQDVMDYQEYYLGTGYSVGIGKFSQINHVLDKFNEREIQEKDFTGFRSPNGIAFAMGTTQTFFNVEAGFVQIQQRRKTTYNDNNNLLQRDVRLRMNSYYLGIGIFLPVNRGFGIGAGVNGDYYNLKLSTRIGNEGNMSRVAFITPSSGSTYGTSVELKFYFGDMNDHGTKLMIKPYYSIMFNDFDVTDLDNTINGENSADDSDSNQNLSHFGITFLINYSIRK